MILNHNKTTHGNKVNHNIMKHNTTPLDLNTIQLDNDVNQHNMTVKQNT